jgi:hypothetical protein
MKTIILGIAAVAFSLVLAGNTQADEERMVVDPSLQGNWKIQSVSKDQGLNMDKLGQSVVAQVSATHVILPNGDRQEVKRVRLFTDDKGQPVKWIFLSDGEVLEITRDPGQPLVQVKVLALVDDRVVEEFRFVMTVENVVVNHAGEKRID